MAYREERSIPEPPGISPSSIAPVRPEPARPAFERPAPDRPAFERPMRDRPAGERSPAPAALSPPAPTPPADDAPAKPRSRKRLVLATILVLVLGFGGYEGYGYWTNGRFMVSTDDAYVTADITILTSKVSGYVTAVEARTNQRVEAGDVIARLDDGDYRLAVRSAGDKLATQRATVERIDSQIAAARAQVAQAQPQIEAAKAEALRSAADFERQTRLSQADYASKARLEQSRADRDRADASVRTAEAALAVARANVDVLLAQRREAEQVAAELGTALARAERDLSFTEIRAPVSGVIGNRAVEVGSWAQPGMRLAALVPLASVHIDANFKETQLVAIRPGQTAHIEVDAFPGRDIPAKVESIAPASGSQFSLLPPENATGNFTKIVQRVPVRIAIDPAVAAQSLLRPGLSVVVRIDSRERPGAADADAAAVSH